MANKFVKSSNSGNPKISFSDPVVSSNVVVKDTSINNKNTGKVPVAKKKIHRTYSDFSSVGRTLTSKSFGKSLLCFILLLLLSVNMFLTMQGNTDNLLSFEKILNIIADSPSISTDWIHTISWHIDGDWGLLDVFRGLLNNLSSIISMFLFVATAFANITLFCYHFLYYVSLN